MAITFSPNSAYASKDLLQSSISSSVPASAAGNWVNAPANLLLRLVAAQQQSRQRAAMRELNRHRPFVSDTSLVLNDVTADLPFRG